MDATYLQYDKLDSKFVTTLVHHMINLYHQKIYYVNGTLVDPVNIEYTKGDITYSIQPHIGRIFIEEDEKNDGDKKSEAMLFFNNAMLNRIAKLVVQHNPAPRNYNCSVNGFSGVVRHNPITNRIRIVVTDNTREMTIPSKAGCKFDMEWKLHIGPGGGIITTPNTLHNATTIRCVRKIKKVEPLPLSFYISPNFGIDLWTREFTFGSNMSYFTDNRYSKPRIFQLLKSVYTYQLETFPGKFQCNSLAFKSKQGNVIPNDTCVSCKMQCFDDFYVACNREQRYATVCHVCAHCKNRGACYTLNGPDITVFRHIKSTTFAQYIAPYFSESYCALICDIRNTINGPTDTDMLIDGNLVTNNGSTGLKLPYYCSNMNNRMNKGSCNDRDCTPNDSPPHQFRFHTV